MTSNLRISTPSHLFPVVQSILTPLSGDYLFHTPLLDQTVGVQVYYGVNPSTYLAKLSITQN